MTNTFTLESLTPTQTLVAAVKAHAGAHYSEGGWDYIVECWTDAEIAKHLADEKLDTEPKAIRGFTKLAKLLHEREREVQAEIF